MGFRGRLAEEIFFEFFVHRILWVWIVFVYRARNSKMLYVRVSTPHLDNAPDG